MILPNADESYETPFFFVENIRKKRQHLTSLSLFLYYFAFFPLLLLNLLYFFGCSRKSQPDCDNSSYKTVPLNHQRYCSQVYVIFPKLSEASSAAAQDPWLLHCRHRPDLPFCKQNLSDIRPRFH